MPADYTERMLRLPTELNEQIKKLAEADGRSANNYIVQILKEYVADELAPNPPSLAVAPMEPGRRAAEQQALGLSN